MRGILRMIPSSYGVATPLTDAWIVATSESDTTIISALRTFEDGLISNSFINRLVAVYPFVGGNASKHSYNFMNTANFQLTFFGGITHNANGFNPNGSTGYAKTGVIPSVNMNGSTNSFGFYSRTSISQDSVDVGTSTAWPSGSLIFTKWSNGVTYYGNNDVYADNGYVLTDTLGLISLTRNSSTVKKIFRRGTLVNTTTQSQTSLSSVEFHVGGVNAANPYLSTRNLSFVYFANESFTDAEMLIFSDLIHALQTTLSRQV